VRPSQALYSALAPAYREHFEVAHRRAYDALAWERIEPLLPGQGPVVDAGCGVGRWAARLMSLGYDVIGIEQAPGMIAELRRADLGSGFSLIEESMETARLPDGSAGMVLALGSLQYTADPEATITRFAGWVRPGGTVAVLVDSLVGLVLELLRDGKFGEALTRLQARTGRWAVAGHEAEMHLMDAERLRRAFAAAGLGDVDVRGLLITAAPLGPERLAGHLGGEPGTHLALERQLQAEHVLADVGKQLLATGRRPGRR
jgi:SAM-dependent methyltransferase